MVAGGDDRLASHGDPLLAQEKASESHHQPRLADQSEADMTAHNPTGSRPQHDHLVLAAVDAYLGWRAECDAVWNAYRCWSSVEETGTAVAFQAYAAALEREEHASQVYANLMQRIDHLVAQERELGAEQQSPRKQL